MPPFRQAKDLDEDEFGGLSQALGVGTVQQSPYTDEQALKESSRTLYDPSFTNIGRIQQANAGQGAAMAGGLAGAAAAKGKAAQSALGAAQSKFKTGVNSDQPFQPAQGKNASPYAYAQGSRNPMAGVATPQSNQSAAAPAGAYGGPESLMEGSPELEALFKDAADSANQLGSEEGVGQAIKDQAAKNSGYYGTASNAFDAFLTNTEGQPQLEQAQSEFGGLEEALRDANSSSMDDVTKRKDREKRAADAAKAGRTAELDARRPKGRTAEEINALNEQVMKDGKTESWLADIRDKLFNEAGFIGLEGWKGDQNKAAWERAFATGDGRELAQILARDYGYPEDTIREIANAIADARNRKSRQKEWTDYKSTGQIKVTPTETTNPLSKAMNTVFEPLTTYLVDEQIKRNKTGWSPDTVI